MIKKIKVKELLENIGQIKGVPANPRFIKDKKFEKLKESLQNDPEMLELRELLVFKHDNKFVIIGGNMRYKAALELGIKELPCKIISPETPIEKLKAYIIKDNISYGEYDWDMLDKDWDDWQLTDWGIDLPIEESEINVDDFFNNIDSEDANEKSDKLVITLPFDVKEHKNDIKKLVEETLSDYKGIKVK